MNDKDHATALKEWAHIAIAKHTRRILKYEVGVLQDRDPEDLHQMRVGMRRLRSAMSSCKIAVDLPKTVTEKKVANIGRSLGKLRDFDVLLAALQDDYRPLLPAVEQKSLDMVLISLAKERKHELDKVRKTLNSKVYSHLKQGLQSWLDLPTYQTIGDLEIYTVLPDLLLPQIAQFLLHPGWFVGVELKQGRVELTKIPNTKQVEQLLERENPTLHDLRKLAKKTRYNLELFSRFYDDAYQYYVKQIEEIQKVLGQIQDSCVLQALLERNLKSAIAKELPELATLLTKTRYQKWQEWSILQLKFLDNKTRTQLRQTVQHPANLKPNY